MSKHLKGVREGKHCPCGEDSQPELHISTDVSQISKEAGWCAAGWEALTARRMSLTILL